MRARNDRAGARRPATASARTEAGWRCPQCGRRFRQRTREHSCQLRSLDQHLAAASDLVKDTMRALEAALDGIGPHGVVPVKTMILLRGRTNFGSIVVRQRWLELGFISSRLLRHARLVQTESLGPRRYAFRTRLCSPAEVDAQIVSWLTAAYVLGAGASPHTRDRSRQGDS